MTWIALSIAVGAIAMAAFSAMGKPAIPRRRAPADHERTKSANGCEQTFEDKKPDPVRSEQAPTLRFRLLSVGITSAAAQQLVQESQARSNSALNTCCVPTAAAGGEDKPDPQPTHEE